MTTEATTEFSPLDTEQRPGLSALALQSVEIGSSYTTVIEPRSGWKFIDFRELYQYRDLFRFLVWRSVKTRYAQSVVGIGWAVIQPVFSMIVFTLVGISGAEENAEN